MLHPGQAYIYQAFFQAFQNMPRHPCSSPDCTHPQAHCGSHPVLPPKEPVFCSYQPTIPPVLHILSRQPQLLHGYVLHPPRLFQPHLSRSFPHLFLPDREVLPQTALPPRKSGISFYLIRSFIAVSFSSIPNQTSFP